MEYLKQQLENQVKEEIAKLTQEKDTQEKLLFDQKQQIESQESEQNKKVQSLETQNKAMQKDIDEYKSMYDTIKE